MAYGVVIKAEVQARLLDNLNRVAKSGESTTVNIENGSVVVLASKSATAGEKEVWLATQPATATLTSALWMVATSENPVTTNAAGTKVWRNDNPDPRDFINLKDKTFSCFKLSVGDEIILSADALAGSKSSNTYVVAADGAYKLTWGSAISGPSLKLLGDEPISLPNGTIGDSQRQTAYRFIVEKLA